MAQRAHNFTAPLLTALSLLFACKKDPPADKAAPSDSGEAVDSADTADSADSGETADSGDSGEPYEFPTDPDATFATYCGEATWTDALEDTVMGDTHGDVVGSYSSLPTGTLEAMSFVPEHPTHLTRLRLWFASGQGTVRLRLMSDYGGSYADIDGEGDGPGDLTPAMDIEVESGETGDWFEVDVSERGIFLHPNRPIFLLYSHLSARPTLTQETVPSGESSRASIFYQGDWYAVGDDNGTYNYKVELEGETFCERAGTSFSLVEDPAWGDLSSQRATFGDVNGDRVDDLVLMNSGPQLYLGRSDGTFEAALDPWPELAHVAFVVLADLDNDGDVDAVAPSYVSADGDGDGYPGGIGGEDCNDADALVYPGATEDNSNGYDDDCDAVADDGLDETDADGDGVSILDGDCDDTRDDVYPAADELQDSRDNDCDLVTDEDFGNVVALNDGSGMFNVLDCPDLYATDPTGAAALGDGDGDGVLDLYYGNWLDHYPDPPSVDDRYLEGDGLGCFTDAGVTSGVTAVVSAGDYPSYGVVWGDYNDDGLNDIYVSNYGYGHNLLFENQGDGTFSEVGSERGVSHHETSTYGRYGGNTFGADWGDMDNDGDLDLIATNIAHPRYQPWSDITQLYLNEGSDGFTDVRSEWGLHYDEGDVNATFVDFDNDGDLDLSVASLYPGHYSRLYRNDGDAFVEVSYQTGVRVHDAVSTVWADVDADGDMDAVIADRRDAPYVQLYLNEATEGNHWLELFLEGRQANRSAVGARVTVEAGGVSMTREVKGGGGHSGNQSTLMVHFGLGGSDAVDSVTVRWPGGDTETFSGAEADGRFRVVEGAAVVESLDLSGR